MMAKLANGLMLLAAWSLVTTGAAAQQRGMLPDRIALSGSTVAEDARAQAYIANLERRLLGSEQGRRRAERQAGSGFSLLSQIATRCGTEISREVRERERGALFSCIDRGFEQIVSLDAENARLRVLVAGTDLVALIDVAEARVADGDLMGALETAREIAQLAEGRAAIAADAVAYAAHIAAIGGDRRAAAAGFARAAELTPPSDRLRRQELHSRELMYRAMAVSRIDDILNAAQMAEIRDVIQIGQQYLREIDTDHPGQVSETWNLTAYFAASPLSQLAWRGDRESAEAAIAIYRRIVERYPLDATHDYAAQLQLGYTLGNLARITGDARVASEAIAAHRAIRQSAISRSDYAWFDSLMSYSLSLSGGYSLGAATAEDLRSHQSALRDEIAAVDPSASPDQWLNLSMRWLDITSKLVVSEGDPWPQDFDAIMQQALRLPVTDDDDRELILFSLVYFQMYRLIDEPAIDGSQLLVQLDASAAFFTRESDPAAYALVQLGYAMYWIVIAERGYNRASLDRARQAMTNALTAYRATPHYSREAAQLEQLSLMLDELDRRIQLFEAVTRPILLYDEAGQPLQP